jgi:alpha-glucosidase
VVLLTNIILKLIEYARIFKFAEKDIMVKVFLLAALLCGLSFPAFSVGHESWEPEADRASMVIAGNARFTVLTPRLIRMEWSEDAVFEDRATLTFVNRRLPVPQFKVSRSRSKVVIKTSDLTLTYKNDGKFTKDNLKVEFFLNGKKVIWCYGMEDEQNLMGTTRTLDGCNGSKLGREPMEKGILSRSGWSVVDDSRTHVLVPVDSHWREWVESRSSGERQDIYMFAYGHDYKQALEDYSKIAGASPMPPKYTFGYWWSRYWQYSDNEFRDLVANLRSVDIPIDVLIVDMDWHETWGLRKKDSPKDEYGQRIGWTGYTWQNELFPSPDNFLQWTENEGLKVALNLHPASGIEPFEAPYEAFAEDYGWDRMDKGVPFRMSEQRWADSYFYTVLAPMEKSGVDFWWIDWQQWRESKYIDGLSNTFWLNHTFFRHAEMTYPNVRPFIYHRWGGLGSHRYQLAFSGDTYATWETLAFLPWFTSTASNVNYGYWGHDIGGHMFHKEIKETDPELYTRWLQYGVFTPIFKTHSTKDQRIVRYPWAFPDHMFIMRDAIRLRYDLLPYIYNASRENYDTGVAMCRPMYYDYPEHDKAYESPEQYMFGNDILATAVAQPCDSITGLAERKMWFPEGMWYDFATGMMYEGDSEAALSYTLAENPWYAKAGSIIPMNPSYISSLQEECNTLVLVFVPGADGSLRLYEDDGMSQEYKEGGAWTSVYKRSEGNAVKVRIGKRDGGYDGAPDQRAYELRFPSMFPPEKVSVDGRDIPYKRFPSGECWTYDAYALAPVVHLQEKPCGSEVEIDLSFTEDAVRNQEMLYGLSGIFNRCVDLTVEFKFEQGKKDSYLMLPVEYLKVSQCPNRILEFPDDIMTILNEYRENMTVFLEMIDEMSLVGEPFKQKLKSQLSIVK